MKINNLLFNVIADDKIEVLIIAQAHSKYETIATIFPNRHITFEDNVNVHSMKNVMNFAENGIHPDNPAFFTVVIQIPQQTDEILFEI